MASKKSKAPLYLALFVAVIFIVSVAVFLGSTDTYNGQKMSGWDAIKLQYPNFFAMVIIGTILAVACGYLAYAIYEGVGVGRNVKAGDWLPILLAILAFLFLSGPWGKACTDKANGGFGLPKTEQR